MSALDLVTLPARQGSATREIEHRPWPLPEQPWLIGQTWDDLLFAHWPLTVAALRPYVPPMLELDTYDGCPWLGITPFRITAVRARGALPLPGLSTFIELNVRTYVRLGGRPGIWFFSLDASSPLAVRVARRFYRLPYFRARMRAERRADEVCFASAREGAGRPVVFSAAYGSRGEVAEPRRGTLEHFLTERYCLYTVRGNRLFRADIHHRPWPLQAAAAAIELNTMVPPGLRAEGEPLLHLSRRQDVVIWPLALVSAEDLAA